MTGVGHAVAEKVWYRTLTTKLTSSSGYAAARNGAIASAKELYGKNSTNAWPCRTPSTPSGSRRAPRPAPTSRSVEVMSGRRTGHHLEPSGSQRQTVRWSGGSCTSSSSVASRGRERVAALGLAEVDGAAARRRATVIRSVPAAGATVGAGAVASVCPTRRRHRAVDRAVRVLPVTRPSGATDSRSSKPAMPPVRRRSVADAVPPGAAVVPRRGAGRARGGGGRLPAGAGRQRGGEGQGAPARAGGRGVSGRRVRRHPPIPPPVVARGDRSGVRWVPPTASVRTRGATHPSGPVRLPNGPLSISADRQ